MAGDWVKLEKCTPDKPEVVGISIAVKMDRDAVVGKLFRLWAWADAHSISGAAVPVTDAFIDDITRRKGFAAALRKVGWLRGEDGALTFPNFDRHNGETAKARAESNRRMTATRERRKVAGLLHGCCKNVAEKAQQKAQPEKRREENTTPLSPTETSPHGGVAVAEPKLAMVGARTEKNEAGGGGRAYKLPPNVDAVYQAYPRHEGKGAAIRAIEKAIRGGVSPETLLDRTRCYAAAVAQWTPEYRYSEAGRDLVPHPATWFNQRRWEDDQATWLPRAGVAGAGETRRQRMIREAEKTAKQREEQA